MKTIKDDYFVLGLVLEKLKKCVGLNQGTERHMRYEEIC
jgi:hypothetical protein